MRSIQANPSTSIQVRPAAPEPLLLIHDLHGEAAGQPYRNFRWDVRLRQSGSSQFSEHGLRKIRDQIRRLHPGVKIIDVDLRQEPHGFSRGAPAGFSRGEALSWREGERDWPNIGKSPKAVEADQSARLLAIGAKSEAELCSELGVEYVRLPVTDHMKPESPIVEQFLDEVESRRENGENIWLHFHCEAGRGRTTTFMALDEIVQRAGSGVRVEDILEHQSKHMDGPVSGGADLAGDAQRPGWRQPHGEARLSFVRGFHERFNPRGK